jgi:6-phosphofructokinase 1
MGRSSGFIAIQVGMGGGAETVILPDKRESIQSICNTIERGIHRGKTSSIIVVAEGAKPGHSSRIAADLTKRGYTARFCILGHTQRGGIPTAHDRVLASILGASAVAHLLSDDSNSMVGIQHGQVTLVPFNKVIGKKKDIPSSLLNLAQYLAT